MRRVITLVVIGVCPIFEAAAARAYDDESPDAYEIAAATAVSILPEAIRPFFEENLEAVRHAATAELAAGEKSGGDESAREAHYVMLDVAAVKGDFAARYQAAAEFPRDRDAARELFKRSRRGIHRGGTLPWVTADHFNALTDAFRAQDREAVLRQAGRIVHFSTDAALPFNTTVDRDGEPESRFDRPRSNAVRSSSLHRTVRHRYQTVLIQAYRSRFEHEVRVYPGRFHTPMDPIESIFRVLREAHASLDELTRIDRDLRAELDITDVDSFAAAADRYYGGLADRAGPIMESRLEAGALLGADLIGAAWVRAGSPPVERLAPAVATTTPPAEPSKPSPQSYVGSRNSDTFHRASCPHAKRIKPENLVSFPTVEAARAAGRKPCRVCKPEAPDP